MTSHFTFFASYYDCVEELDSEIKAEFLDAICRYALRDEEPQGMSPFVKSLFSLAQPNLDKSKARREAGKAGGKQKRKNTKQNRSKNEANSNHLQRDKETEKEKEREKEPPPEEYDEIARYINFSITDANPRDPLSYSLKIRNRIEQQGGLSATDRKQLANYDSLNSLPEEIKQKISDYKLIISATPTPDLDRQYSADMGGISDEDFRQVINQKLTTLLDETTLSNSLEERQGLQVHQE